MENNDNFLEEEFEGMDEDVTITMTDEAGNEYEFVLFDEFDYKDDTYLLLTTVDEEEPELVIVKVIAGEDEIDMLISIDEEEFDEVFAEYQRLVEEEGYDEDDDEEEE